MKTVRLIAQNIKRINLKSSKNYIKKIPIFFTSSEDLIVVLKLTYLIILTIQ